jgi:hypothetical protein
LLLQVAVVEILATVAVAEEQVDFVQQLLQLAVAEPLKQH